MIELKKYKIELKTVDKNSKDIEISGPSGLQFKTRLRDDIFEISDDLSKTLILALEVDLPESTGIVILTKMGDLIFAFEVYDKFGEKLIALNMQRAKLPRFTSRPKEISISENEILVDDGQEHLKIIFERQSILPMRYELYRIVDMSCIEFD